MIFLQYTLAAIIAFSGLFVGAYLARATKEEMPTASRYLPWMQKILVIAIVAFFLNILPVNLIIKVLIYALLIVSLLKTPLTNMYFLIGFIFFMLANSDHLFTISTLVFLYGFPTGSLFIINKKLKRFEVIKEVFLKYWLFLVISIGLQLAYSFFILKSF